MVCHLTPLTAGLLALLLLFTAGIWGTYIIAFLCESAGRITRRVFLDKYALQMARLGTLIHMAVWIALGGCTWLLLQKKGSLPAALPASEYLLWGTLGSSLLGTVLLALYFATWKVLKKGKKPLHILMGGAGILCMKPLFWIPLAAARALAMDLKGPLYQALPPCDSLLWPLGLQWVFLAVSLSAVLGLVYLLMRRNRDDFGRDYYKYALPVCARWALYPFAATLLLCGWVYVLITPALAFTTSLSLMASTALAALSLLLAALCWLGIMRSANPLRLKGVILAGVLLTWTFLLGTLSALWEIIGLYSGLFVPQTFMADILTGLGVI